LNGELDRHTEFPRNRKKGRISLMGWTSAIMKKGCYYMLVGIVGVAGGTQRKTTEYI